MKLWTAQQALDHWQDEGLLTKKKADELRKNLEGASDIPNNAIRIFSAVGAILIGLGVILFIASNWGEMTPVVKIALLLAGMIGTAWAGYHLAFERQTYERTGMALLLANIFLFGASIFLVGQIYHLPLNFWWGMLLWSAGTAVFSLILQSRLHVWISIPLFLLFLGGLQASLIGRNEEFEFLVDPTQGFMVLLPALGVALISKSILQRTWQQFDFAKNTLFHWGLFLILLPFVLTTIDKEVLFSFFRLQRDLLTVIVIALSLITFLFAFAFGQFETNQGRWGLFALVLYILFTFIIAFVPEWMGFDLGRDFYDVPDAPMISGLYVVHVLLVFVMLLTVIWYGTLLKMPAVVNLGMIGLAFAIFIQYFSWAFQLLDRSLAFILGGVLILALSAILERKRRELLSSMKK